MSETPPESNDPTLSSVDLELLSVMDLIADETEDVTDTIRGIAILAESDSSYIRGVGLTALESISELTLNYLKLLSPETKQSLLQRTYIAGRRMVAKYVN